MIVASPPLGEVERLETVFHANKDVSFQMSGGGGGGPSRPETAADPQQEGTNRRSAGLGGGRGGRRIPDPLRLRPPVRVCRLKMDQSAEESSAG